MTLSQLIVETSKVNTSKKPYRWYISPMQRHLTLHVIIQERNTVPDISPLPSALGYQRITSSVYT